MLNRLLRRVLGSVALVVVTVAICPVSAVIGVTPAFGQLSNALSLELSADKKQFLLGEPVWIDVLLKNVSQDTVRIPDRVIRPDFGNLEFVVTSGDETIQYTGGRATYIIEPLDLAPGEELTMQFDILDFYGESAEGTHWFEKLFHPRTYSVQARAWQSLMSNTIQVHVIEPSGDDAEIYHALHEAAVLKGQRRFQEAAERLYSLLPSASRSAYRDKLYHELILSVCPDSPRQRSLAAQVHREYPDSRYAHFCLSYVLHGMSRAEAEEYVGELESAAPGTRAALEGRKMLGTYEFRR